MMKLRPFPAREDTRAFTLLEVALIVAIVGMMLLMLLGYAFAPKKPAVLPPVAKPTPIPPSRSDFVTPAPRKTAATPVPAPPAAVVATPAPAPEAAPAPAPAAPAATPAPTQTIDLSPQSVPVFR